MDWCKFVNGLKNGKYHIVEHTVGFDNYSGNINQKIVFEEINAFDIVKEWKQRNAQAIRCRLDCYDVYCRFDDGLMVLMDKGVLLDMKRIKKALNVETSEVPYTIFSVGDTVCENTFIINMTKWIEEIEKDRCC